MIDLSTARYCIERMQEKGSYRNQKIGIVKKDIFGFVGMIAFTPDYTQGDVVLFTEGHENSKPTGRITMEKPLTSEEIRKNLENDLLIMTHCPMVGVPANLVDEVRL